MLYIIANWKCNPVSLKEVKDLLTGYEKSIVQESGIKTIVCPPSCYLALAKEFLKEKGELGAQNCFHEDKGAFTGEISPIQIADLGCKYVIVGHSERRKYFGETDEIVNKKIKAVIKSGLVPILCFGETDEERENGKANDVIERQIKQGLKDIDTDNAPAILAYEPIWAIGTGQACDPVQSGSVLDFIRQTVEEKIPVLYGGSVKPDNASAYLKQAGFNGLLIGGASLKAEEFAQIIEQAQK